MFPSPALKLWPVCSLTCRWLQVTKNVFNQFCFENSLKPISGWPNILCSPPEYLALVFEPEFMNSAGKEVLMDLAEKRQLLPVYRLKNLIQWPTKTETDKSINRAADRNLKRSPSEWTHRCLVQELGVLLELHGLWWSLSTGVLYLLSTGNEEKNVLSLSFSHRSLFANKKTTATTTLNLGQESNNYKIEKNIFNTGRGGAVVLSDIFKRGGAKNKELKRIFS